VRRNAGGGLIVLLLVSLHISACRAPEAVPGYLPPEGVDLPEVEGETRGVQSSMRDSLPSADVMTFGELGSEGFSRTFDFEYADGHILVPVEIDGDEYTFVLDTGAPTTISNSIARDADISARGGLEIVSPTGRRERVPVGLIDVEMGGVNFERIPAQIGYVSDVDPQNPLNCLSEHGLIGATLMKTAVWQINYGKQTISVTDDIDTLDNLDDALVFKFFGLERSPSPQVRVRVGGEGLELQQAVLLVDTGFDDIMVMPEQTFENTGNVLGLRAPELLGAAVATGLGVELSQTYLAALDTLELDNQTLEDYPVLTSDSFTTFLAGNGFLEQFIVTLDWQTNHLYLAPINEDDLHPDRETYGFMIGLSGRRVVVSSVWEGSAAWKAGMQPGDAIASINDGDLTRVEFDDYCELVRTGVDQFEEPLEMQVERGLLAYPVELVREPL